MKRSRFGRWGLVCGAAVIAPTAVLAALSCSSKDAPRSDALGKTAQAVKTATDAALGAADAAGETFGAACESDAACGAHHVCDVADRICTCKPPYIRCNGVCVDDSSDPAHCGACQTACAAGLVCDEGRCATSIAPRSTPPIERGASCAGGGTCTAGSSCVAGVCTCDAGMTACGPECMNTATDWHACGGCGKVCVHRSCSTGVCSTTSPPILPTAAMLSNVGTDLSSTCEMETEGYPTRSGNTGDVFVPYTWADGGSASTEQVHFNATDGGSSSDAGLAFGTNHTLKQPSASPYLAFADSWSTTDTVYDVSGAAGIELFINLTRDGGPPATQDNFVGIGGATMPNLHDPSAWEEPTVPLLDDAGLSLHYDGPAAVYDNSAGRLWAVATEESNSQHARVWWTTAGCSVFPNSGLCMKWETLSIQANGHFTVALHPGNADAMIAYLDHSTDTIKLTIVSPGATSLTIVSTSDIDTSAPHDANTQCPQPDGGTTACPRGEDGHLCKCNGVDTADTDCKFGTQLMRCSRLGGNKVHVIGRHDAASGKDLALIAYDVSVSETNDSGPGWTRFESHLAVWDVTTPSAPFQVQNWKLTGVNGQQTWASTAGGGGSTGNAGWFYFWNNNDPCTTYAYAVGSPQNFYNSTGWVDYDIGSSFPVLLSDRSGGMSDYMAAVKNGLANGHPFASVPMPVPTDAGAGCIPCQDAGWCLQQMGAELQ